MNNSWDIEFQNLYSGYNGRTVLDGITACLPGGAICALLGESGGGKTTLLRLILGLQQADSGRILVGGRDILAMPGKQFRKLRRNFGVLFQDGALLGNLTLAENVALPLFEHTKLEDEVLRGAAVRSLSLVGLEDFADFYPAELSGGMRKRAGLARAIVTEPKLLFCDEPTSGLDPITASQMDQLLLDMKAHMPDMTVVLITHDMESVSRIADDVLVLHQGRAYFSGTAQELQASSDPYLVHFRNRRAERDANVKAAQPLNQAIRAALDIWHKE